MVWPSARRQGLATWVPLGCWVTSPMGAVVALVVIAVQCYAYQSRHPHKRHHSEVASNSHIYFYKFSQQQQLIVRHVDVRSMSFLYIIGTLVSTKYSILGTLCKTYHFGDALTKSSIHQIFCPCHSDRYACSFSLFRTHLLQEQTFYLLPYRSHPLTGTIVTRSSMLCTAYVNSFNVMVDLIGVYGTHCMMYINIQQTHYCHVSMFFIINALGSGI